MCFCATLSRCCLSCARWPSLRVFGPSGTRSQSDVRSKQSAGHNAADLRIGLLLASALRTRLTYLFCFMNRASSNSLSASLYCACAVAPEASRRALAKHAFFIFDRRTRVVNLRGPSGSVRVHDVGGLLASAASAVAERLRLRRSAGSAVCVAGIAVTSGPDDVGWSASASVRSWTVGGAAADLGRAVLCRPRNTAPP
jgi:hypothetical protein